MILSSNPLMESKMKYEIDKFKVNWTERVRGRLSSEPTRIVTSVTGYSYQIDSWQKDYLKEFTSKLYKTKVITKINNDDSTVTITISRLDCPRRD
ncbi:hypothetical protein CMI47_19695 [Candidatus Pacearchaeota archaeon]|nr:hypothetical protein [Candidatus Pacearchaeota archaeon]|tara:strand:- start:718 stop:1002 length:285 start_codon:yes stop_codon:yes gene_type:complete